MYMVDSNWLVNRGLLGIPHYDGNIFYYYNRLFYFLIALIALLRWFLDFISMLLVYKSLVLRY